MTQRWLPEGLYSLGAELGRALDSRLRIPVVGDTEFWLDLPELLVRNPSRPEQPVKWSNGYLCLDLGPDDLETWTSFLSVAGSDPEPESLAKRAQVWRLPVIPFRENARKVQPLDLGNISGKVDLRGKQVLDLTSMWAGPLCSELLGRAGARVIKIEADVRPDGLRFGDGDDGTGQAPMFLELNKSKEIWNLDLRKCVTSSAFEQLVKSSDLVVSSMSRRALFNLGLTADHLTLINENVRSLSINAFAAGTPEESWVAYGTGVHAASGLGWTSTIPTSPAYSYPDPIAGLSACLIAVAQLADEAEQHREVSLEESIAPLVNK